MFKELIIEVLFIILGWLLGLLSPGIINSIKAFYDRKKFLGAAKAELLNLQFQLCITGMLLAQKYGKLDRDYLNEAKTILEKYEGGDAPDSIVQFIDTMLNANDEEFDAMAIHLRAEADVGLNLKSHSTVLIDSNAAQISSLPMDLQSKIYEFKNSLNIYNQEISVAKDKLILTFDSSLSDVNHRIVKVGLLSTYADLQNVCVRVCRKIKDVLDFEL